jgi:hypothetical protein
VNKLRKLTVILLVFAFSLALVAATPVQAKKPLRGTMDLDFNVYWYGYNKWDIPDWIGTITFDGDDTVFGMAFFAFTTGKPFDTQNPGMAFFFGEIWAIYESVELITTFVDGEVHQEFIGTNLLMWGYDYGVTIGANTKYHMNGDVQLDDLFGEYVGRHVYMSGAITYYTEGPFTGFPDYTYGGQFRVN